MLVFPTKFVYKILSTFIHNSLSCIFKHDFTCMWYIIKCVETKDKIFFREDYTTPPAPSYLLTYFQVILVFFGSADQGCFLLKWPLTSPSNQRKLIHLFVTKGLSLTNQNPTIIQACNCRNHKGFQLIDILPFTSQCPHNDSHLLLQSLHLIFCYPNGKTFKLFASPYIIYHTHKYSWF